MANAKSKTNSECYDAFYAGLVEMTSELDEEQAQKFLVRLTLILASHISDPTVLTKSIDEAKSAAPDTDHSHAPRAAIGL